MYYTQGSFITLSCRPHAKSREAESVANRGNFLHGAQQWARIPYKIKDSFESDPPFLCGIVAFTPWPILFIGDHCHYLLLPPEGQFLNLQVPPDLCWVP
jgi:hypothetical protein